MHKTATEACEANQAPKMAFNQVHELEKQVEVYRNTIQRQKEELLELYRRLDRSRETDY